MIGVKESCRAHAHRATRCATAAAATRLSRKGVRSRRRTGRSPRNDRWRGEAEGNRFGRRPRPRQRLVGQHSCGVHCAVQTSVQCERLDAALGWGRCLVRLWLSPRRVEKREERNGGARGRGKCRRRSAASDRRRAVTSQRRGLVWLHWCWSRWGSQRSLRWGNRRRERTSLKIRLVPSGLCSCRSGEPCWRLRRRPNKIKRACRSFCGALFALRPRGTVVGAAHGCPSSSADSAISRIVSGKGSPSSSQWGLRCSDGSAIGCRGAQPTAEAAGRSGGTEVRRRPFATVPAAVSA